MSLVARNEPCPCGSGRKYKKCCLAAREAAVATGAGEIEVKAIIDQAIELLTFPEWFALRAVQGDRREELWLGALAHRVSEVCLDRLDDRTEDARPWLQLAALMLFSDMVVLCEMILDVTTLRAPSADEQAVYDAFTSGGTDVDLSGTMTRICDAIYDINDNRGVALLRETTRQAQAATR